MFKFWVVTLFLVGCITIAASYSTSTKSCGANEELNSCIQATCKPTTCAQLGKSIPCPRIDPRFCKKGCLCKEGFLRDENNKCIPQNKCVESCGANEELNSCIQAACKPTTCAQLGKSIPCPRIDPRFCKNGCLCKEGFLRDENNKCIPQNKCVESCGANEELNSCIQATCKPTTCAQLGKSIPCPRIDPRFCKKGCLCKEGFFRDENNKCIPQNKCVVTCDTNQVYNPYPNPNPCAPRTCDNIGKILHCPLQSVNSTEDCGYGACECDENYYSNTLGQCVTEEQCLADENPDVTNNVDDGNDNDTEVSNNAVNTETALNNFEAGDTLFSAKFFYEVAKIVAGNIVVSAFSVLYILAELLLYAQGGTYNQLITPMNLNSKDEVRAVFKAILKEFQGQQNVEYDVASETFTDKKFPLTESFLEDTKNVFGAEAQNVDFSSPAQAASTINKWVEDHTNNKIKDLITPDMIDPLTRLVLVNALYFKAIWKYQFDTKNTKNRDFYETNNKTVQTPTMYQRGNFRYSENLPINAQILELPYQNSNFTTVIILPKDIEGLMQCAEKLTVPNVLSDALNSLSSQLCDVYLPSLEINTSIDVEDILEKNNITDIFSSSKSNLTGITKSNESLYVSKAVQKAYLKMNEQGSEAAAATGVIIRKRNTPSVPPPVIEFNANHPFIIVIKYKSITLFIGTFRKP